MVNFLVFISMQYYSYSRIFSNAMLMASLLWIYEMILGTCQLHYVLAPFIVFRSLLVVLVKACKRTRVRVQCVYVFVFEFIAIAGNAVKTKLEGSSSSRVLVSFRFFSSKRSPSW